MKKLFLVLAITLLLALSACSLQQYLPDNNESPVIVLNDTFEFTNETVADETNTTMSVDENVTEDVSESNETIESDEESEEETDATEKLADNPYVLSTITVTEGDIASLDFLAANDPDGDDVVFTYSEPFNAKGLWQTNDGDEGKYLVTVTASDGLLSTSETIQVVVMPSNKGPVIECPSEMSFKEGDLVDLDCTIYDREGDEVSYLVTGFMDEMTYQTDNKDAGMYTVVIEANDGNKTSIKVISLTIEDVNKLPVVEKLDTITVTEGDEVKLDIVASDEDGDDLVVVYPFLFDEDGVWATEKGDAGNYELEGFVSDGKGDVVVPISIIVEKLNVPPTITLSGMMFSGDGSITVSEGETITLEVEVSDEDGDDIEISYSGFMTTNTYTTTYDDAGEHVVTITVADKTHEVSKDVAVTVLNKNRPPVFVVN